jgi:hypothetical protein
MSALWTGWASPLQSVRELLVALDKSLRKLISKGHRLHIVYKAGPCGFVIWPMWRTNRA